MRTRVLAQSIVLVVGFYCFHGILSAQDPNGPNGEPKSVAAAKAKLAVLKELQQLRQETTTKEKKILTDYMAQLDDLRKTALEGGDLDEAQRLLVLKRAIENGEVPFLPLSTNRLEILFAQWQSHEVVTDVTGLIRKQVKNEKCSLTEKYMVYGMKDIRPGVPKTLIVVYRYKGKLAIAQTTDDMVGTIHLVIP